MYVKSLLLCLVLIAIATASTLPTRVVGGTPTTIQEFPYVVALTYFYPGPGITIQRCVGSLVSSWHVLTSGFCFTGAVISNMRVRAGSTNSLLGGIEVSIAEVFKHPSYQEVPRQGDIAVVLLTSPLGITENINVLWIPEQGTYIPDGQEMTIVTWGFESESGPQLESLKYINLDKLTLNECVGLYTGNEEVIIDDPVICAARPGPIGLCQGDSGAPMVIDNVLVGLASYYHGCGNDEYPDVFTRIDRYTSWILEVATAPGRNATAVRTRQIQY